MDNYRIAQKVLVGLLALLLLSASSGLFASSGQSNSQSNDARPSTDEVWGQLRLAAKEAAVNSPRVVRPQFIQSDESPNNIEIVKGRVGDQGFGSDPYDVPFRKQILIEMLRNALAGLPLRPAAPTQSPTPAHTSNAAGQALRSDPGRVTGEVSPWEFYLTRAESLVRESLGLIESHREQPGLRAEVDNLGKRIDDILDKQLYEAIVRAAKEKDYNIIFGRGGQQPKMFRVNFETVPEGARVWVMTDVVYRKQLITRTDPSMWPWVELVQNPTDMLGRYRYRAVWPSGRRSEDNIDVNNPNPLKLR